MTQHKSKSTQLKELLQSQELTFLMEAHNGISAKIVEEAGFAGIWASGLTISASLGVRDNNEASWTQVLEVAEYMSDATRIPILLDGDTGHGNFNNFRRFVQKLESRGIAGVCIEDKIFPKTNSFLRSQKQPLSDAEEFAGKIRAGLDARHDSDFCIVARVEALIAGHGMEEALRRAALYAEAGATAVLIHSKLKNASEIETFMKQWKLSTPVIIVPTTYYATETKAFQQMGVRTIIWANHLLRSSVKAMQSTAAQIYSEQNLHRVEDAVVKVSELFRLQNDAELEEMEKRYFPSLEQWNALILSGGKGITLNREQGTQECPKGLVSVQGKPLMAHTQETLKKVGVNEVCVVTGPDTDPYQVLTGVQLIPNPIKESGELSSFHLGQKSLSEKGFIIYGDVMVKSFALNLLQDTHSPIALLVDNGELSKRRYQTSYRGDFVFYDADEFNKRSREINSKVYLKDIFFKDSQASHRELAGIAEWTGVLHYQGEGRVILQNALKELFGNGDFSNLQMPHLISCILRQKVDIELVFIQGNWTDVDQMSDIISLQTF